MDTKKKQAKRRLCKRLELVVSKDWLAEVDSQAKKAGLSRSAYIRRAVLYQMAAESELNHNGDI